MSELNREGWVPPAIPMRRKWHYERDGRTLGGRYGMFPEESLVADGGDGGTSDDCASCSRKLEKAPPPPSRPARLVEHRNGIESISPSSDFL